MSSDPLLQPFQLKHLTLRNRILMTSHEPAYPEDGMPKDRYRAYHVERARGGVAMTMTAGSAAVSRPHTWSSTACTNWVRQHKAKGAGCMGMAEWQQSSGEARPQCTVRGYSACCE